MKLHTTNYLNTFIQVADDCPALLAEAPPVKNETKTVAAIQYEMISANPYKYTSDDVLFGVYAERNGLTAGERAKKREEFFSKGQPCFRASPLTKRYGWGVHCDEEGRIALVKRESDEYKKLSADKNLKVVRAMRAGK